MENCFMKKNIKTANNGCNFFKCIFADLTVTGITDNDEKISVTTMRFPLKTAKIKNLQKRWTSLVQTRSVVTLFTVILIHKNKTLLHKRSKVDAPENILEKADVANVNGLNDKLMT